MCHFAAFISREGVLTRADSPIHGICEVGARVIGRLSAGDQNAIARVCAQARAWIATAPLPDDVPGAWRRRAGGRAGCPPLRPAARLVPRLLSDQPWSELTRVVATVLVAAGSGTEPNAER